MSTQIKRAMLIVGWALAPKSVKGVLYRRHRAIVAKKLASGKPYG